MSKNKKYQYHFCQPWVEADGHPLSSTLKLYDLIKNNNSCLILCQGSTKLKELPESNKIKKYNLNIFEKNINFTTIVFFLKHLIYLSLRKNKTFLKIFYLDSSPIILIILIILFSPLLKIYKVFSVSTILLPKPEKLINNYFFRFLIRILPLCLVNVKFFSRTTLINNVYHKNFINRKKHFLVLPMLELIKNKTLNNEKVYLNKNISFGLFGQLRNGKSIEDLVSYFSINRQYNLIIAGKSWTSEIENIKNKLTENIYLLDKFLTMKELDFYARRVDFHLLLYSYPWDIRMESGNYYLALKHLKPVISYSKGWLASQITTHNNGYLVNDFTDFKKLLNNFKKISNNEKYRSMQINGEKIFQKNTPEKIIKELFRKL